MQAKRTKPVINPESDPVIPAKPDTHPLGCVRISIGIVLSYFIASALARFITGRSTKLDQTICFGILIIFVGICILGAIVDIPPRKAREAAKKAWKDACTVAEVTIVNCRGETTWDDGYRYHTARPQLELEMNSDQRSVAPYHTTIGVEVGGSIYKKLEKQNSVRIYYKPKAPLAFFLEEEL